MINSKELVLPAFPEVYPAPCPNTLRSCRRDERLSRNILATRFNTLWSRCGIYFTNGETTPRIPKKNLNFWRFFLCAVVFLTVFLSLPKQATQEISLSADNLLSLVNQDRSKHNLKPLQTNSRLMRAAYAKGEHMLRNSYFAHVSPEGVEPWDFIRDQNFSFAYAGENLARGYTSSYELINDFLQSSSHRENLLSPLFTETGIAVIEGELDGGPVILTVQIFAAPSK